MPPPQQQGQKTCDAAREPGVSGCTDVFHDAEDSPRPNFSSMAQYNLSNDKQLPKTGEGVQVLTVKDYLQAMEAGKIPKGPNHQTLVELAQKPQHLNETKVIVLSYNDNPVNPAPHKSV